MVGVRDTGQSHQSPTEVGERAEGSTTLHRHTKSEQPRQSEGDPKVILMLCESGTPLGRALPVGQASRPARSPAIILDRPGRETCPNQTPYFGTISPIDAVNPWM